MLPESIPSFDQLPKFHSLTGCAWSVWGENDELGTVNMLTEELVSRVAKEEIRSGKTISLNWPINFPQKPMMGRKTLEHNQKHLAPHITPCVRDEEIYINTQSGTQWDGLRHFGVIEAGVFYNNTPASALPVGHHAIDYGVEVDANLTRLGIQNWAQHGICGRGVLLDLVRYFNSRLPYDPCKADTISAADLEACAKSQGVEFKQGDILLIRIGFIQKYIASSQEERGSWNDSFAGLDQSEDMKRFLWNNHFAAVASDQPALERWPVPDGVHHLHQTILGLWGMPIGEFFDLEKLAEICAETKRYTFFFSSWPLNIIGGCASPANAAAYF